MEPLSILESKGLSSTVPSGASTPSPPSAQNSPSEAPSLSAFQRALKAARTARDLAADPHLIALRIRVGLAQRAIKRSVAQHEKKRLEDQWADYVAHAESSPAPWKLHNMEDLQPHELGPATFRVPQPFGPADALSIEDIQQRIAQMNAGLRVRQPAQPIQTVAPAASVISAPSDWTRPAGDASDTRPTSQAQRAFKPKLRP